MASGSWVDAYGLWMRRTAALILVLIVSCSTPAWAEYPNAGLKAHQDESREADGLQALETDPGMQQAAQEWAETLAATGELHHAPGHEIIRHSLWTISHGAGENVGVGPGWLAVSQALNASPVHAANRLHPGATHTGVGIAVGDDGRVWVVERVAILEYVVPAFRDQPKVMPSAPTGEAPRSQPSGEA